MKQEAPKKLLGTVSATSTAPSFSIPIFCHTTATYVQSIDANDTIVGFNEIVSPGENLSPTKLSLERIVGDRAVWAFDFAAGETVVGSREILAEQLRARVAEYKGRPFLLLEVASFLDDPELIREGLRLATGRLEDLNSAVALDWLVSFCSQRITSEILRRRGLQSMVNKQAKLLEKHIEPRELPKTDEIKVPRVSIVSTGYDEIIAQSEAMKRILAVVERVARLDASVLISGESGTGKELIARLIHKLSPRHDRPFVTINCSAIPDSLLESELFGHEEGAFTGAVKGRAGYFERAYGGTILLDEISELPIDTQAKLLRVFEKGQVERVGSNEPLKIDVRVITTTNDLDLSHAVAAGTFREDLYYWLSVFPLHLPPLRQRREDIPGLLDHFLRVTAEELGQTPKIPSPEVLNLFMSYDWPGNVRELKNVVQMATFELPDETIIKFSDLPIRMRTQDHVAVSGLEDEVSEFHSDLHTARERWQYRLHTQAHELRHLNKTLHEYERDMIIKALESTGYNQTKAASMLGMSTSRLRRSINRLDLREFLQHQDKSFRRWRDV